MIDDVGYLDSERRLIGLAKGKNPYISALCPAYPEVRQYWLSQLKEFIEAGVDGVEFRWSAHQDSIDMDSYGFNQPIVEEYKRRHGVNILTEEFDKGKWRQLRGEYYTQFLREADTLLTRYQKKMMVDVMPTNDSDPNRPQFLNIHLDWEKWFSLADGVSFKWVHPDTFISKEAMQGRKSWTYAHQGSDLRFRRVADKYGIPTYYNVWPQVVFKGMSSQQITERLRQLKEVGHAGFMLYEANAFMKAKPDGTFDITYPEIPKTIVPAVKAMNEQQEG